MAGKAARRAATSPVRPAPSAAPRDTQRLDRLIHDRVRLGILSALSAVESMSFADLKTALDVSDGNLSVHARKLEEAGYISCTKYFEGRLPKTEYKLTAAGRSALENYLSHMESLIKQMRNT